MRDSCDTGKSGAGRGRKEQEQDRNKHHWEGHQVSNSAHSESEQFSSRPPARSHINRLSSERGNPIQHTRLSLRPVPSSAGLGGCCGTTHRTDKTRNASHSLFSARVPALQHIASSEANSEGKTVPTTPPGMEAEPAVERIMLHWGKSPDLFPCCRPSWLAACAAVNGV
jgi:hypothetical protein